MECVWSESVTRLRCERQTTVQRRRPAYACDIMAALYLLQLHKGANNRARRRGRGAFHWITMITLTRTHQLSSASREPLVPVWLSKCLVLWTLKPVKLVCGCGNKAHQAVFLCYRDAGARQGRQALNSYATCEFCD